jgi:hypothetical protein
VHDPERYVRVVAHERCAQDAAERCAVVGELRRIGRGRAAGLPCQRHRRVEHDAPAHGAHEHHGVDERLLQPIGQPRQVVEVGHRVGGGAVGSRLDRVLVRRQADPVGREDDVTLDVGEVLHVRAARVAERRFARAE